MPEALINSLLAGLFMTLMAVFAGVLLFFSEKALQKITPPLMAFAAGALIGSAFFHIIPESIHYGFNLENTLLFVCLGFAAFLFFGHYLHWHHHESSNDQCHHHQPKSPVAYLLITGDIFHNIIGGFVMAQGFIIDPALGWIIFFGIAVHELPHELGDIGVLIHSGWGKKKAFIVNLISASTSILGVLIGYFTVSQFNASFLIPLTGGMFLYIGATELLPDIAHQKKSFQKMSLGLVSFIMGMTITWLAQYWMGHHH